MAVKNNIPHTTYTVDEDPVDGVTLTVTCDNGYTFDGVPTIDYDDNVFGDHQTNVKLKVNDSNTIATITDDTIDGETIVINGNTTGGSVEPVAPTVVNNITDTQETHTVDGSNITLRLTSTKVMQNVNCAYTDTTGINANVSIEINVTVGVSSVSSVGEITLSDVDFTKEITLTGDAKAALPVEWSLSGCSSESKPNYAFLGEPFAVTLTADTGNEFSDNSKNYIEPQGAFVGDKVLLTISKDKQQAKGSYTPTTDEESLYVIGEAQQVESPVKKYGFINAYVVTEQNLEFFATKRFVAYTGSSSTDTDPINYDLGDYVNRVKRFFFEVEKGSTSKLNCGNFVVDTDVFNLATDVKRISFGTVDVPNFTESSADYSTEVILFVPFVGVVSVGSEVIGQTVELTLSVNLLSGDGVYTLTCGNRIVWTQQVKPCTDVIYRTSAQDVKTIGGANFDASYLMGIKPYLVLDRKEIKNNGTQATTDRLITIGDLTGYNKVTDIQFNDTTGMLQEDIDEITQTLRLGFTL